MASFPRQSRCTKCSLQERGFNCHDSASIYGGRMTKADTKKCSKCNETKDLSMFYMRSDGKQNYRSACKSCFTVYRAQNVDRDKAYHEEYYKTESVRKLRTLRIKKYRIKFPEKRKAHDKVHYAIRTGRIERQPCQRCGSSIDVHAHHWDYSQPLSIMWLCRKHHVDIHEGRF